MLWFKGADEITKLRDTSSDNNVSRLSWLQNVIKTCKIKHYVQITEISQWLENKAGVFLDVMK